MDDFGYDKTDIYIVTYPRSGTTLLQMMLYQITTDGEYNFDHLGDAFVKIYFMFPPNSIMAFHILAFHTDERHDSVANQYIYILCANK